MGQSFVQKYLPWYLCSSQTGLWTKASLKTAQAPWQVILQRVKPRRKLLFCTITCCTIKCCMVTVFLTLRGHLTSQQHIAGFPLACRRAEKDRKNDATVPALSFASVYLLGSSKTQVLLKWLSQLFPTFTLFTLPTPWVFRTGRWEIGSPLKFSNLFRH